MRQTTGIIARFPERELEIRRLCARDPTFAAICADHDQALVALRHWQAAGAVGESKTKDYSELVTELEAEIMALLDGARGFGRRRREG